MNTEQIGKNIFRYTCFNHAAKYIISQSTSAVLIVSVPWGSSVGDIFKGYRNVTARSRSTLVSSTFHLNENTLTVLWLDKRSRSIQKQSPRAVLWKGVLENLAKENNCAWVSFLVKFQTWSCRPWDL